MLFRSRCRKNDGSTLANLPASDTQRVSLKSPVRANRTPESVRRAPGNRCPYLDKKFAWADLQKNGWKFDKKQDVTT